MKLKSLVLFSIFIFSGHSLWAQLGGSKSFVFADYYPTARFASLGGSGNATFDQDITAAYMNPAMHNASMHHTASLNYINYLADINSGYAGYAWHHDSLGTFSGHITFTDYGHFDETDETGAVVGQFWANDYVFQIGFGRKFKDDPRFSYGLSFKFLYSTYEAYVATAGAFDGSLAYVNEDKKFFASLMFRNLGYNFIPYDEVRENLPLDVQFALSKKLEHNPLRFTMVIHDLQQWDISYVNTNLRNKEIDLQTGQVKNEKVGFGDKMMRHFNFGGELVFSDNFQLRIGYNYQRRRELGPETIKGATGFSWGVGFGIKKFKVDYAMVTYFPGIHAQHFTVSKNLSDFKRSTKHFDTF